MRIPHPSVLASHAYGWLSRSRLHLVVAAVAAVGLIASVSIFAAGETYPPSCPAGQSQPLYRLYSNEWKDHFYTMSKEEAENATKDGLYTLEGTAGYIFPTEIEGTVPLYRMWNGDVTDHFYTTSWDEYNAVTWYSKEGIAGYVFPEQVHQSMPLYRMYNNDVKDHFYTNSGDEYNAVTWYAKEGGIGYVYGGCKGNPFGDPVVDEPTPAAGQSTPQAGASPVATPKPRLTAAATPGAPQPSPQARDSSPQPDASPSPQAGASPGAGSGSDRANPTGSAGQTGGADGDTGSGDQSGDQSGAATKGAGVVPSAGTATVLLLATFGLAVVLYYGRRWYVARKNR